MRYLWVLVVCCLFVSCKARVQVESTPGNVPTSVAAKKLGTLLEAEDYGSAKRYAEEHELDESVVQAQCRLLLIKMVHDKQPKEKIVGLTDHCGLSIEALQSVVREYLNKGKGKKNMSEISQIGQPKIDGELITENDIKNFYAREIYAGKNPEKALQIAVEYDLSDQQKKTAAEMLCLQVMAFDCQKDNSCAVIRERVTRLVQEHQLDLEKLVKILVDCGHEVDPLLVYPIRVVN